MASRDENILCDYLFDYECFSLLISYGADLNEDYLGDSVFAFALVAIDDENYLIKITERLIFGSYSVFKILSEIEKNRIHQCEEYDSICISFEDFSRNVNKLRKVEWHIKINFKL